MAMNVGAARDGEPVSEINTTPLIDVMLVLLIMLIVTLPPQRHAVKLDSPLPCLDCASEEAPPEPVRIIIDFDGVFYWNGVRVSRADMEQRLSVESRRSVQPEIHVEPHRMANYGDVAAVLASVQRAGLTRLGVVGGT